MPWAKTSLLPLSLETMSAGAVVKGCLVELTKAEGPWLNAGDLVELEMERIGILKNIVGGKNHE